MNEVRKIKRTTSGRNKGAGANNKIACVVNQLGEHLETQEFTFMAVICMGLFCYNAFMKGTYEMSAFMVTWRIAAVAICLFCIVLIFKWSNHYWNMDEKAIQDNQNKWTDVMERMQGKQE